jgi:hypothetical protein
MAKLKLKYVNEYIDRTGKLRRYFRKGGRQLGTLPGEVGSDEFMAAYAAYLNEQPAAAKRRRRTPTASQGLSPTTSAMRCTQSGA